jgi:hypothetical protein
MLEAGHGAPLPVSCNTVGITRVEIDTGPEPREDWMIGCVIWKHVFCVSVWDTAKKKYGRACSVAKQIKFAYADSCKEYTPSYSVQHYKAQPGRTQNFDYTKCTLDGCPDECLSEPKTSPSSTALQVITQIDELPEPLQHYHRTYGICNLVAATR